MDGGSLSAASRTLRTPLPTVSRRVSDLEAHLGAQLLVRTSRKLTLTEAGETFVARGASLTSSARPSVPREASITNRAAN
ncbi:helix-turn-helix domain-containing protein [Hankyongella ginsenosidimutans]|uniref:helix-turn-helix domain-containing protein n=1 Tax=Hankyongella ginsenosidimutans TaxID=1763828 RepID=UPI001FEBDD56|nr:LysR family transcriptional regulator [Hankyongella ginsenosidimutans]